MTRCVEILEDQDVILATDFVRYMEIEYVGQSDAVLTTSTYGGSPVNFFRWLNVVDAGYLHWIGKTVGEFSSAYYGLERAQQPIARLEFARGDIPADHIMHIGKNHPAYEAVKWHRHYFQNQR